MFIGSINQHLREILKEMAVGWQGLPVYVGCSGNFTVERVLSGSGISSLHGNDVSLYSCAVGLHLGGGEIPISIKREDMAWLGEYLQGGVEKISALLLCSAYFQFLDRGTPYHKRMERHYRENFARLHAATTERVKKAIEGVQLQKFYPMDVMDYVRDVVPPTGEVQDSFHIKNTASSLTGILDVFTAHRTDLQEGFMQDDPGDAKKEVPASTVFGTDRLVERYAVTIVKALKKAQESGQIQEKNLWEFVFKLSEQYLTTV
ncbi:hypothetical protein CCP3SC15_5240002 [Gammaproteobacteria bacterium]